MVSPEGDHASPHTRSWWSDSVCMSSIAAFSAMVAPLLSHLQWRIGLQCSHARRFSSLQNAGMPRLGQIRLHCCKIVREKKITLLSVLDEVKQESKERQRGTTQVRKHACSAGQCERLVLD